MKLLHIIFVFCCSIVIGFSQTVELQSFATGFSSPVEIANTGVASDTRLFIVEKAGIIKILNADGSTNTTPFLDINSKVSDSGGERGLLGLTFHPNYDANGYFYVNYINNSGNSVISRYSRTNATTADATSELILLTINQPASNHNGGKLAFGSDGYLYIATGDGGGSGDPNNLAQNLNSLLGKMLRIDIDNTNGSTNYAIPSNNPYLNDGNANTLPEIWAYGLRNPWKFSFDKNNNDLWIGDVGQDAYEEINKVTGSGTPGGNYGWNCYEGNNHPFNTSGICPPSGGFGATIAPVAEYAHTTGCSGSITGGYVYRGTTYASFIGKYFFAEYCKQTIGILSGTGSSWSLAFQTPNITQGWTTFGEDINGELYIAGGSTVYKIIDANLSTKEYNAFNFKLYPNPSKGDISIDLSSKFNEVEYISLYNIQEQKITSILKPNKQVLNLSTENYSSGLYFIEVVLNNSSKSIKKLILN